MVQKKFAYLYIDFSNTDDKDSFYYFVLILSKKFYAHEESFQKKIHEIQVKLVKQHHPERATPNFAHSWWTHTCNQDRSFPEKSSQHCEIETVGVFLHLRNRNPKFCYFPLKDSGDNVISIENQPWMPNSKTCFVESLRGISGKLIAPFCRMTL